MKRVDLIADGSCLAHRGPGGWACLLIYNGRERVLTGGSHRTTNNQMELKAVTMGLLALREPCEVSVFTDSKYVQEGMSRLVNVWSTRRWRNSRGRPLPNQRLWTELRRAAERHRMTWHWVKGHGGDVRHNRCDLLARNAARSLVRKVA